MTEGAPSRLDSSGGAPHLTHATAGRPYEMTTMITAPATPPPATTPADAGSLVADIERYLADHAPTPATAHPLVTKTTAQLIAEALAGLDTPPAPTDTPQLAPPRAMLRHLPTWALPLTRRTARQISPAEHLELTALLIERWGWAQGADCGPRGTRCIRGAQQALLALGYGDATTLHQASAHLYDLVDGAYDTWNDHPDRTLADVLRLLRTAANTSRNI